MHNLLPFNINVNLEGEVGLRIVAELQEDCEKRFPLFRKLREIAKVRPIRDQLDSACKPREP